LDLRTADCCPAQLFGRVGGCEVGIRPWAGQALGEGWGWLWHGAMGLKARSPPAWKGTKDRRQRGHTGGRAMQLGWQGQGENSPLPAAELEATGDSPEELHGFP